MARTPEVPLEENEGWRFANLGPLRVRFGERKGGPAVLNGRAPRGGPRELTTDRGGACLLPGGLQGVPVPAPLPDGLQLLLDALRRRVPAHAHRGGRVRREAAPAVVPFPRLG